MVLIDVKWTLISDFDFHQSVLSAVTEETTQIIIHSYF